jgi:uncharacterized protein YndB with AHSA1/START domain
MGKAQSAAKTTLQVKRTLRVSRDRVFRAWTDPRELARWFAPSAEYSTVVPELELRVGGRYRVEMHHKGGNVHRLCGTYREIKPPEKVVFTWRWEHESSEDESLVTIELRGVGDSTELTLTHEHCPSEEERDKRTQGWAGCLDQLAKYL